MKRTVMMCASCFLMALLLLGCSKKDNNSSDEPEDSVAAESTWDYFIVGSWHYTEASGGKTTDYPEGIETFLSNGEYVCYTQDKSGDKVIISGTWKLDDEEDYVIWVTQESIKKDGKTVSDDSNELKYVVNSLAPEESFVYQVGKTYRSAKWMGQ